MASPSGAPAGRFRNPGRHRGTLLRVADDEEALTMALVRLAKVGMGVMGTAG